MTVTMPAARTNTQGDGSRAVLDAVAPAVTVVICAYTLDRWDLIRRAVASVLAQTVPPTHVVLVVDYCPELLHRARATFDGVEVVPNIHRRGLSGARNTGVERARGDVVAFLDDDAAAAPDWLARTTATYTDDTVLGVGGLVEAEWADDRPRWFPPEFDWVVGCSHLGLPTQTTPVRNVIGANMSFRRDVLTAVGGFDTGLGRIGRRPLGCEETELCIRAGQRWPDRTVVFSPFAVVRHHVPAERGRWGYLVARCWSEGLSKAAVAVRRGSGDALSSERGYVRHTLPAAVLRGFAGAARDPWGIARAAVVVLGLAVTTLGYLAGRIRPIERAADPGDRVVSRRTASPRPRRRSGLRLGWPRTAATCVPLVAALALWLESLRHVDLPAMSDTGLVSVLPVTYWVALATVITTYGMLVHRDRVGDRVLTAYAAALVLILHATPSELYGSLRYSWAWKHLGIVDYVLRHGTVDPSVTQLPVYQAWPGFFTLNAALVRLTGVDSAASYAAWAPPFFELIDLAPLLLILRALTPDRRRRWVALFVYVLANWVGQDYFSPQAFAFFLYLSVIAIALSYLSTRRRPGGRLRRRLAGAPLRDLGADRTQRAGLLVVVVLAMAVIASSHQLTPVVTIGSLALLVALGRTTPRWLPWVMLALTVGWILWWARGVVDENLTGIIAAFGQVQDNTQATFVDLGHASFGAVAVSWSDRLLTAMLWPLAVAGFYRQWRYGRKETTPALLAALPVPLLFASDYGGEMLFRVFMFALPFLAFHVSGLLQGPDRPGRIALDRARAARRGAAVTPVVGRRQPGRDTATSVAKTHAAAVSQRPTRSATVALCLTMSMLFVLAYYGKERMNWFPSDERAASRWLYAHAPRGSLMSSMNSNYPWAFVHYDWYDYDFLQYLSPDEKLQLVSDPAPVLEHFLDAGCDRPAYFVETSSQDLDVRYTGDLDPRIPAIVRTTLATDAAFRAVYRSANVTIYQVDRSACPLP